MEKRKKKIREEKEALILIQERGQHALEWRKMSASVSSALTTATIAATPAFASGLHHRNKCIFTCKPFTASSHYHHPFSLRGFYFSPPLINYLLFLLLLLQTLYDDQLLLLFSSVAAEAVKSFNSFWSTCFASN